MKGETDKIVITPKFEATLGFENGIAIIFENSKFGYIDKKGNWIWKPTK
jgi:hypothetical protein